MSKRVSHRTHSKTDRYRPAPDSSSKRPTKKQKISVPDCVVCERPNNLPVSICSNEDCAVSVCLGCVSEQTHVKPKTVSASRPVFGFQLPKCQKCSSPYLSKPTLMNRGHYALLQHTKTAFTCPLEICTVRTGSLWDLAKHLRDDHGALKIDTACPFCRLSMSFSAMQEHVVNDCKRLVCPVKSCLERNLTHKELLEHLEEHRTIKSKYTELWVVTNSILRNALQAIRQPHLHAQVHKDLNAKLRCLGTTNTDLKSIAGQSVTELQAGLPRSGVVDSSGVFFANTSQSLTLLSAKELFRSMKRTVRDKYKPVGKDPAELKEEEEDARSSSSEEDEDEEFIETP